MGVAADVLNEQPERWGGVAQQDGNVGRTDVLAGGALSYVFGSVVASMSVKTPVYQHFIDCGASEVEKPMNVGGEIMVATLKDPWNNLLGLIYNPEFHFQK